MTKKITSALAFAAALSSCAAPSSDVSVEGKQILSEMGCKDAETRLFDRLIDTNFADPATNPTAIRQEIVKKLAADLGDAPVVAKLDETLKFLIEDAPNGLGESSPSNRQRLFAALELGIPSNSEETLIVEEYQKKRQVWAELQKAGLTCAGERAPIQEAAVTPLGFSSSKLALPVRGLRWAFASAYQSCEVLQSKALVAADPDVQGIKNWCCHPDGIGQKRVVENLSQVQRTHPYLKAPPGNTCLDVRANPLIYDYGGKPGVTGSTIDFHRNAGDGTSAMGVDCSGYVSASLATAGLKFKSSVPLRPSQTQVYSSSTFLNPESSGLNCVPRITLNSTSTLKEGDIVAVQGHVVILDHVGADPFGLNKVTGAAGCAKITTEDFDFEVVQSSPSKGGVGMNRFEARDYLRPGGKMAAGLVKYAKKACELKFSGGSSKPSFGDITVLRHAGTASCMDARVPVARESCIDACFTKI